MSCKLQKSVCSDCVTYVKSRIKFNTFNTFNNVGKILNYKILGTALKSLSDACFKADEQQRNGEKVTACGMSDEDLDRLCDIIPNMLNPMMSTEEVKEKLHVSDATLNRMVARGDIPNGECKKRGHTRYFKKWDILHYIKSKRGK